PPRPPRPVLQPVGHCLVDGVRAACLRGAAHLLAEFIDCVLTGGLGPSGHFAPDVLAVRVEPETYRSTPAAFTVTVVLGVPALPALGVLEADAVLAAPSPHGCHGGSVARQAPVRPQRLSSHRSI